MAGLHDLGERWVVPDRVEVGVVIHLAEIGIVVLDRLLEQFESIAPPAGDPSPCPCGRRLSRQRKGTGGVITQVCILWLLLDRCFQGLHCFVGPFAEFRRHDGGQVEPGTLRGVFLLELRQFGQGVLLLAEPGEGDDPVCLAVTASLFLPITT